MAWHWRWQRQEVDLKKGGIVPIANLGRFHALANGITISPTLDRLIAAEELGALDKETAQSLREAFAFTGRSGLITTLSRLVRASRLTTHSSRPVAATGTERVARSASRHRRSPAAAQPIYSPRDKTSAIAATLIVLVLPRSGQVDFN